jgi:iron-sulfur cluster assembly accessory protein
MLQELEVQSISLTSAASQAVKDILTQRNLQGYALRVYVAGGGCGGVNIGVALDNNIREQDQTYDLEGVKLVIDQVSIDYLRGATIDFVNDPQRGPGFAVDSPTTKRQEHEHGEGGCSCGGSCSCND